MNYFGSPRVERLICHFPFIYSRTRTSRNESTSSDKQPVTETGKNVRTSSDEQVNETEKKRELVSRCRLQCVAF